MSEIRIIPLGGMREIGKNMYVVEVDKEMYVLDCGLSYPEESQFGIDTVIPDFSYVESNADRLAGIFLTDGHMDVMGALPYFLEKFDAPVFGTALTIELAKLAIENLGLNISTEDFHVIDEDTKIEFEKTSVEFFKTTHTIPDSVGISINTGDGSIVYTGDFRIDQSTHGQYRSNLLDIAAIGNKNVLALLSDSTNAESYIENASEIKVAEEVRNTFLNSESRIIVSAVSDNILRIQQVLDAAYHAGRKVFLTGRNIEQILEVAIKLEKLELPEKNLIQPIEDLGMYDNDQIIILEAPGPGESIKQIERMAEGFHKQVTIEKGDLVYVVTSPSASLDVQMGVMKNKIYRAGGTVETISDNIFASGHGTPDELKLMLNLIQPTYFIPVQGDYSMLSKHATLAHEVGIPSDHIFILKNGDVVTYNSGKEEAYVSGQIQTGNVLVDGSGVGDIGNIVLRDRRILSEDGVLVAVVTIDRRKKKIISGPKIVTRGFVFVKESVDLIEHSESIVRQSVEKILAEKKFDWGTLKQEIRDNLGKELYKQTNRRPIILPVITAVKS